MLRALCVVAGLIVVATGQTPFDLAGVHPANDRLAELAICAVVLLGVMAVSE